MCWKIYALPLGVFLAGVGSYFFISDSLTQYQQQHVITITQANPHEPRDHEADEQRRMKEELDKIKESANVDFIYNTLATNLSRIHSYASIEFEEQKPQATSLPQAAQPQAAQPIPTAPQEVAATPEPESIDYIPYRQIHTHSLQNAFQGNLNVATENHFDVKNTAQRNPKTDWVIPIAKEAKIYRTPSTQADVVAINKNGIKMQVVDIKQSWVHVRYAARKKLLVEGYIPRQNIRFAQ